MFEIMDRAVSSSSNAAYKVKLRQVMMELVDANENMTDLVFLNYPVKNQVYDLFYLNAKVNLAIQTLNGYSNASNVQDQMAVVRYYVSELMYVHRKSF